MSNQSTKARFLRWLGVAVVAVAGTVMLAAQPASAATLTKVSWAVSNSQTGATGIVYSYSFTPATTGTVASVTMSVPAGTSGTPSVGTFYGIGAGTVSLTGTTITYAVTSPASLTAGLPVYIEVDGMTNTSTPNDYTSDVTTLDGSSATIDSGTSQSVTFGSSTTAVNVTVAETLTFTNDTPSFNLAVDPTGPASSQQKVVNLTVQTNAATGYTLSASDTTLQETNHSHFVIPATSGGATLDDPGFGVSSQLTVGAGDGATLQGNYASDTWAPYATSATPFVTSTGPTGNTADTLTLTNGVAVDYTVPAGLYTDTITYVATPGY